MKNKFFDKPEAIPFIIFNIFITFIFILLLFSVCDSVHAASDEYYFPMSQDENNKFDDAYLDFFNSYFDWDNDYVFIMSGSWNGSIYGFYAITIPKNADTMIYGEIFNNAYNFSLYKVGSYALEGYRIEARYTGSGFVYNNIYRNDFFGNLTSSNYSTDVSYLSNFQLYTNNNPSTRKIVLIYGDGESEVVPGFATRPDKQERMDFLHNNRPDHVPEPPTVNNYSWTLYNPPSIDTSSIEAILESLLNRTDYNFSYLFSNLGGIFSNLISNIGSYFEYLGELISYGFDVVVNNIIAGIENFYDNMVSLIEPLVQTVNSIGSFIAAFYELGLDNNGDFSVYTLFSNVISYLFIPDPEDLSDLLVSHDIYGIIDLAETTQTNVNYINSLITAGDDLYIITLPQFTIMGVICGPYNIDFSWYLPLKNAGDSIISAFLVLGWFMWLYFRLPYWLRGQQGDITHLTKEVNK